MRFALPRQIRWRITRRLAKVRTRWRRVGNNYVASRTMVNAHAALEESFFLGLRMNRGVSLAELREQFSDEAVNRCDAVIIELVADGLMEDDGSRLRLTERGRLLSNEVFGRFLQEDTNDREAAAQKPPVEFCYEQSTGRSRAPEVR